VGAVLVRPLKRIARLVEICFHNAPHRFGCRNLLNTLLVGLRMAIAPVRRARDVFVRRMRPREE